MVMRKMLRRRVCSVLATLSLSSGLALIAAAGSSAAECLHTGTDAWAVGYSGEVYSPNARTLIEHWNGRKWSVERSPDPL